ncbi:hypothetical protein TEA_009154 [Camellia sinensis var. sinensis]|uniref:Peptidyl-prolyl cis-trans isomerase n=1 Tax=Camellia sinensis var. sinensis TaxID=542762 RepID=A0A4S4EIA2_CAMSN|nr:hypothetical protein TEA_009154 [Camellia sinensis var. sinensis]
MCKDSKPKESGGKGKGKQARGGSDNTASKGKGKGAKTDGLGTCTYVKEARKDGWLSNGDKVPPAEFAELAAEYSECPSGKKGGALGWFPRGKMAGLFQDIAFSTTVGATSAPFKSTPAKFVMLLMVTGMDTTLCCRKGGRIDRTWHSKLGSPGLLTIKSNSKEVRRCVLLSFSSSGRLGHKIAPFGASSVSSAEDEASQTSWPSAVATCADSAVS